MCTFRKEIDLIIGNKLFEGIFNLPSLGASCPLTNTLKDGKFKINKTNSELVNCVQLIKLRLNMTIKVKMRFTFI